MAHILVVDDEPALCTVLTPLLRERGHTAQGALSGEAALAAVRRETPDDEPPDEGGADSLGGADASGTRRPSPHPSWQRSSPAVIESLVIQVPSRRAAARARAARPLARPLLLVEPTTGLAGRHGDVEARGPRLFEIPT